jgi:hypothetical protein
MKKIRTHAYDLYLDKNGIVHWDVIEHTHMESKHLKESLEAALKLSKGKKIYTIVNAQPPRTMTPDAQEYLQKEVIDKHSCATAVVTERLGVRIMIEYMINVIKVKTPLKLFTNEKDAMKWLLTLKHQKKQRTLPAFHPAADKIQNKMRTTSHELYLDKNGIMHRKVVANSQIDIDAIKATDKISMAMNKGKKLLLLVNARTPHKLTAAAATYMKKNVPKTRIATAVLSGGANTKVLTSVMSPKKGNPPVRMFIKETEAVKWLLSFKKSTPITKKAIPTGSPKRKKSR